MLFNLLNSSDSKPPPSTMAKKSACSRFVLRNYPDDDALDNREKYPKTLSFSPDIIPLYGLKPGKDALLRDSSWRGFSGMPVVGGDVNHVYIRGHGSGGPYAATLRAFPSELILWPQVWRNLDTVPSGPVVISSGDTPGRCASEDPLWFRPPHDAGNGYSLVANVFELDPDQAQGDSKDFEPLPSFDAMTFDVDDLFSFLSDNDGITFYNVTVADPTLKHVAAHTRLRMFSKSSVPVHFRVDGAPIPEGLQVSLHDDHGKIAIHRCPLSSFEKHPPISLNPGYDGHLTLKIHSPADKNAMFEPFSGLSLKVFKVGSDMASSCPDDSQLMGAMNILFDPHSTRNIRHASPFARELRECKKGPDYDHCPCPKDGGEICKAIPQTKPQTTGWWFRAYPQDTNHSPYGYTPDIQLVGTDADLTKPGLWKALQDPNVDYAKANNISLKGGANNYIFLRGHSTIVDIDTQARIFAIVGSPILHPSVWATPEKSTGPGTSIPGLVLGEHGRIDSQTISVADANQFYLFNRPLNIKAPPDPNPSHVAGPSWMARPHYCLVAEVRQKRKCSLVFPKWPSEQTQDFKTLQDFANWQAACPLVCCRNVNWIPCKRKPGEKCYTWTCGARICIPEGSFCSTFWTIIIECDSPIIPHGCKWTLTCDDNEIFPNGICFEDRPIDVQCPAYEGCHFTGIAPGSEPKFTLTITWCDGEAKCPPPSIKFKLSTTEINGFSPISHHAEPFFMSDNWWLHVGKKYPYLGKEPHPSPLPSFEKAGRHPWAYQGYPQHSLGVVALGAKEETA